MKVIINNTNQVEELSIIDYKTGTDWTVDLLGNAGVHTGEEGAYHLDREDYEWWATYIDGHEATEKEIAELAENADVEYNEIQEKVFDYMGQQDMENERGRAIQILAELKEEYGVA
jgi:hypothetical protein